MSLKKEMFIGAHDFYMQESDGIRFNYDETGPSLRIVIPSPTPNEVMNYRTGRAKFALYEHGGVMFFMSRFGTEYWSDAPYSIQLLPPESHCINPDFQPGHRYTLAVQLVDSVSGHQRGARLVTLSPEFSLALHRAIELQLRSGLSRVQYDAVINEAYSRFPQSEDMLRKAFVRCTGGQ